jgi:[acyl-carrier-protein] S-malonyltransferase
MLFHGHSLSTRDFWPMSDELKLALPSAAVAFRGYNVKNLGRSDEMLAHPVYGPTVEQYLQNATEVHAEVTGRDVDLAARVRRGEETTLDTFSESIALVIAMELVQLQLLEEYFDTPYSTARVAFGYSLGEVTAVCAGGCFSFRDALRIPLAMSADSAEIGSDVMMGIFFSRGEALDLPSVHRICNEINVEGRGVIGISAFLSPNSLLLLGQGDTVDQFKAAMGDVFPGKVYLRKNTEHWPPLHTSLLWERNIPNRAAMMMRTVPGTNRAPQPPVLSMVTGEASYNDYNWRDILNRWTDHPQRLWDVVQETCSLGIQTMIHVGPQPNILPATFKRLSENVSAQTAGVSGLGVRAMSRMVRRPWLAALLPERTALLRAPQIRHVILEDWLLEHAPGED